MSNKKQTNLPSVQVPSPLPYWLQGYNPLLVQAKLLNNSGQYGQALTLAKEDFNTAPSAKALDIICDCCVGLKDKKGFKNALDKMAELKAPQGLIYLNNAIYSIYFLNDLKKFEDFLIKTDGHLTDLSEENISSFFILKSFTCKDAKKSLQLLDKALVFETRISPQTVALIHYYKATAYMNTDENDTAYNEACLSVKAAPNEWEGRYARALAGAITKNLDDLVSDCEFVINHKDADEESKRQMAELNNALIEKLLHPKNAKISVNGDCLRALTEHFLKGHTHLSEEFISANTFKQAKEILCESRLQLMIKESIESASAYAKEFLKPIMTGAVENDLDTLQNDIKFRAHKDFTRLFWEVHTLILNLEDFMTEELWYKSGQPVVFHCIMELTIPASFSEGLPNLRHLKDEKADGHIQKIRWAIKQINCKYSQLMREFIYGFTMTAAKYDADISIPNGNK